MEQNGISHDVATHITVEEAAYLRTVREQAGQAFNLEQEATKLEQQAAEHRQQAQRLHGAHQSYAAHLCQRYGLNPDQDQINHETREITRVAGMRLVSAPAE